MVKEEKLNNNCNSGTIFCFGVFSFVIFDFMLSEGENRANLDNFDNGNRTRNAVQMTREMTTSNGCHVTLVFPRESLPGVRRKITEIFVAALEKGVSGYKVSANDRDIIVEVREMTLRKEFDVLPVFMFDRLGHKEDETPFPVKWFIGHGTEVWSAREGRQ